MIQVFLGLIIVGLAMTAKVILDGLRAVNERRDRITALRTATQQAQVELDTQTAETEEAEEEMEALKSEVTELNQEEKEMSEEIGKLRSQLDSGGKKFKMDM